MTPYQLNAIVAALRYLIVEGVPVPKTTAAKRKRTELLQLLVNVGRIPDTVEAPAAAAAPAESTEPQGPVRLEIEMTIPTDGDPLPSVRPGTVAGIPRAGVGQ